MQPLGTISAAIRGFSLSITNFSLTSTAEWDCVFNSSSSLSPSSSSSTLGRFDTGSNLEDDDAPAPTSERWRSFRARRRISSNLGIISLVMQ